MLRVIHTKGLIDLEKMLIQYKQNASILKVILTNGFIDWLEPNTNTLQTEYLNAKSYSYKRFNWFRGNYNYNTDRKHKYKEVFQQMVWLIG